MKIELGEQDSAVEPDLVTQDGEPKSDASAPAVPKLDLDIDSIQNPSESTQNYLRDYAIAEPTPLGKAKPDNSAQLAKQRRRKICIVISISMLIILAIVGVGVWWFWQKSRPEVSEIDENPEEALLENVYTEMLSLDDERVSKALAVIEKVKYVEPFLSFYPIAELTLADLNETQSSILIDGNVEPMSQSDGEYRHMLYMAEIDEDGYIYLYENILVAHTNPCINASAPWLNETCTTYYSIIGKPVETTPEMTEIIEAQGLAYRLEGVDSYKWTFVVDETGEYKFEKVTRVE